MIYERFLGIKCTIAFFVKIVVFYSIGKIFSVFKKPESKYRDKKVAIYTAIFGGYDSLPKIVNQSIEVDFISFSDKPTDNSHWKSIIDDPPISSKDNRFKSKWYKINPHLINALNQYDYTIYVDSSIVVFNSRFAEEVLQATEEIGFFLHGQRNSIIKEAKASELQKKYADCNLVEQAERYVDEIGKDNNLWAGGVIVRKAQLTNFNNHWWNCMKDSLQDQISLPVALHRSETIPSNLPGSVFKNLYMMFWTCHRSQEYASK